MLRRLVLLGTLVLLVPASAHAATPRINGGPVVTIDKVPYTALVQTTGERCSGAIIDATTIWTAAHCVVDEDTGQKAAVSDVTVTVGTSQYATDGNQSGTTIAAASYRAMPRFPADKSDDVAVIKLSKAIDLSGPNAKAIAVAAAEPAPGSTIRVSGYGIQGPSAPVDGKLRQLDVSVTSPFTCTASATFLCAAVPTGTACNGDSGGPVVSTGATPTLVGLVSRGDQQCPNGEINVFTRITAPELMQYLRGNDNPPIAPRKDVGPNADGGISGYGIVGSQMTCTPGTVSGSPAFSATFYDATTGAVLQNGPSLSYTFVPTDAGRRVTCGLNAANAGGVLHVALGTTDAIVPLRDAGLSISVGSTAYVVNRLTDATSLTLTTYDASGKVVRTAVLSTGSSLTRPKLAAGAYKTCLSSPQTRTYAAGLACAAEIVPGKASALVRRVKAKRKGSRYKVTIAASGAAVGRKVTIRWRITRKGVKTKTVTKKLTLKSSRTITSPSVPRKRTLTLQVSMPSLTSGGVPYSKATASLRIGKRP